MFTDNQIEVKLAKVDLKQLEQVASEERHQVEPKCCRRNKELRG